MSLLYDFHMHSALSPCGDDEMTPNNIVNMALLNGLDAIALTDHNSCKNCKATIEVGEENGLIVIPGMELTTQEEIHIVCLFEDLNNALSFSDYVKEHLMWVKNKPEIFGNQFIMDKSDNVIDKEEGLLIVTTDISVDDTPKLLKSFGGIAIPAHIDRSSYSIISSLGIFPEQLDVPCVEFSRTADIGSILKSNPVLNKKLFLHCSDAHRLADTEIDFHALEVEERSIKGIIRALKSGLST